MHTSRMLTYGVHVIAHRCSVSVVVDKVAHRIAAGDASLVTLKAKSHNRIGVVMRSARRGLS